MQSKSKEIRELAVNAVMSKSLTPQKAAEVAGVSVPTMYSWIAIYKKTGSYEARHPKGNPPKFTAELEEKLRELIEKKNDLTLKELVELLGNVVQKTAISRQLIKMGYSYKKNSKGGRTKSS